jgi:hypothetical protein
MFLLLVHAYDDDDDDDGDDDDDDDGEVSGVHNKLDKEEKSAINERVLDDNFH